MRKSFLVVALSFAGCTNVASGSEPTSFVVRGAVEVPNVTHVMAVSATDAGIERVVAAVTGGQFAIELAPSRPWSVAFVDAYEQGGGMTVGVLRSGELDTLFAMDAGALDLGYVTIGADGYATPGASEADVHAALGFDEATAATIGALDDLALRYVNPDLDINGEIDDDGARLDLHRDLQLTARGHGATMSDLVEGGVGITSTGMGIYARMPNAFGAIDLTTASVTFEQPFYGVSSGVNTAVVPAGEPVTGSEIIRAVDRRFGVYTVAAVPTGTYHFATSTGALDFTHIRVPSEDFIAPSVQLVMRDGCEPTAISFTWNRHSQAGWTALTQAELDVLQPGGHIDVLSGTSFKQIAFPVGAPSGTILWNASLPNTAHVGCMSTDSLFLGLSTQTAFGMSSYASATIAATKVHISVTNGR